MILIGGIGEEEERLNRLIEENNLHSKVKLLGYLGEQEKYDYLESCFLFCLPSITKAEAFGVAIIEAMSFAKPIISTNRQDSGVSWVNKAGETGIQVDIKSPEQLAKAFKQCSKNQERYEIMAKNALRRFNKLFTGKKMIDETIKLYKSLV